MYAIVRSELQTIVTHAGVVQATFLACRSTGNFEYTIYIVTSYILFHMMDASREWRTRLRQAAASDDRAERTLRIAAVLSAALSAAGCRSVLVGDGAVEIYTRSAYTTHDLDFLAASTEQLQIVSV